MKPNIEKHFANILGHLYINPLERCNLSCKICYTKKTSPVLTEKQILDFVEKYQASVPLKVITFCGGEVMLIPYFPHLVNQITSMGIFVQMITNGSIDKLGQFDHPNLVNMIVSIDGLPPYHDSNRGSGSFRQCQNYLVKAKSLGFHSEIFSIVTHDNFSQIEEFESFVKRNIGDLDITYHPRKPPEYLANHPISNIEGAIKNFGFVLLDELRHLYKTKKVFPPQNLGCYQISLVSDGRIFGCCEGTKPIGTMSDEVPVLIEKLRNRVISDKSTESCESCLGCSQPDFMCGIKSFRQTL